MKLVNLLPQSYKKNYRVYLIGLYIRRFLVLQTGIALIAAAAFMGLGSYYRAHLARAQEQVADLQKVQQQFNVEEIRALASAQNETLKVSAQIIAARPRLSLVLDELARLIPPGVTIDNVTINAFPTSITMKGRAQSRDRVVLLQNRLEGSQLLKLTFAPLSNLTQPTNTPFEFTLNFDAKKVGLP